MADFPGPECSIVIAAYKNGEMLKDCLESIDACLGPPGESHEVVVVINGAQFEFGSALIPALKGVRLIESAVNLGFSGGYNLGCAQARGKYLVLLNDDTMVEPDWLSALVAAVEREPGIGAVGSCNLTTDGEIDEAGSVVFNDGSTMAAGRGMEAGSTEWDFVRDVDYCSASSLLVTRDAWNAVGGLDDRYHPAYHEDVDLCLRIRAAGFRIVYEPRSRVKHRISQSTEVGFRDLLMRRNRGIASRRFVNKLRQLSEPPRVPDDIARTVERAAQRARGVHRQILLVDDLLPSTGIGAGFSRPIQMLQDLRAAGDAVSIAALGTNAKTSDLLRDLGVRVIEGSLAEYLERPEISIDVAVISRPNNVPLALDLIRRTQPTATVIMDHEALYHRRLTRQAAMADDAEKRDELTREAAKMRAQEDAAAAAVDFNVCISQEEADYIRSVPDAAPVMMLEPRAPATVPTPASLEGRRDMLFVAGWMAGAGSPNVDAIVWFVDNVMPRIRATVPWARVRVTGSSPPRRVRTLASDAVQICGYVDDLSIAYGAARAVIAPIRVGAGVKIKTVEALEYGVPTVATVVGAEGIELGGHTDALVVTDDADEYADALVALLTDSASWHANRLAIDGLLADWAQRSAGSWVEVVDAAVDARHAAVGISAGAPLSS